VDILGPLPVTENRNKYIIVFCEYLTKFSITKALPNITADTVARTFVDEIGLKFEAPTTLLSDQGSNFMSQLVKKICELCRTKNENTSPYHPMTDGLVERTNKTLAQTIQSIRIDIWKYTELTYRSSFNFMMGRIDIMFTNKLTQA